MASAAEYAQWITENADKKGTPEFNTVANAYQAAKIQEQKGSKPSGSLVESIKSGISDIKELFPQNHEEYLALRAKIGNPTRDEMLKEYSQIGLNFASPSGVGQVTSKLFPGIAETVSNVAKQTIPERLMQSALKPTIKQLESGQAKTAIQTLLKEDVNPTLGKTIFGKGIDTLQAKVDTLNSQIVDIIKNSKGTVNKSQVVSYLDDLEKNALNNALPAGDIAAIQAARQEFLAHPLLKNLEEIPVQLAQKLKVGTYKSLGEKAYGELKGATIESGKTLARGLKDLIGKAEPGVLGLNKESQALYDTLDVAERRAFMEANKDIAGLSTLSKDAKNQIAMLADRNANFKALLARTIYKVGKTGEKYSGLLGKEIPYTSTTGKEVIPPLLVKGGGLLSQFNE
jgi:hypothetical protein